MKLLARGGRVRIPHVAPNQQRLQLVTGSGAEGVRETHPIRRDDA
jgi:hypothetical protein